MPEEPELPRLPMHIRHQVTPTYAIEMLGLLEQTAGIEASDNDTLLALASELGLDVGSFRSSGGAFADILKVVRKLGLVNKNALTDSGKALARIGRDKRKLAPEMLHFLLYTGAGENRDQRDGIHWGYREVCGALWSNPGAAIEREALSGLVVEKALRELGYRPAYSVNSIEGVLNWLRELDPPVIEEAEGGERFRRRGFCPPELLLLGISDLYRQGNIEPQSNLPLNAEVRDHLTRLCMIEPESLDRVLGWAVDQFPILSAGSKGFAGHHVLLERLAGWDDVCP